MKVLHKESALVFRLVELFGMQAGAALPVGLQFLDLDTMLVYPLVLPLGFANLTAYENGPKSSDRQGPAAMLWHDYLKTFG